MEEKNEKIIFMGTPLFAADILSETIKSGYSIVAVFTQPDKKVGRKREISFSPVKKMALENKLEIFQPDSLKNEETVKKIQGINPDLIVVAAYGKILPKEILEIPRFGCLNVHASLLPKYRGASPIQNAILANEKETGVTLMLMDEKMDAGDVLGQKSIRIEASDTAETLARKLSRLGAEILVENISHWFSGKIKPKKQDEKSATFCRAIKREDGAVDWRKTALEIYNQWRAFQPWPGAYTDVRIKNETKKMKLVEIAVDSALRSGEKIGKVIEYNHEYAVQTGKGLVFLKKVQLEGKKVSDINDFRRGHPDFAIAS